MKDEIRIRTIEAEQRASLSAEDKAVLHTEATGARTAGVAGHISVESRPLARLSDEDLLRRLTEILGQSRGVEKDLVAHIAEVDARRLYAREAFPSMFAYCTDALHLSEGEAYLRISVARASREHPVLLELLADGRLHLSGIALIAPHLTPGNRDALLRHATHKTKRQIEELTTLSGMGRSVTQIPPDVGAPAPPMPAPAVQPLAPGRYKVQFTASASLREKLERLQALMRSQIPDGDLGAVIDAAVTEKLERLEARRFASTSRPRTSVSRTDTSPGSRYIPAPVRRAVRERDGNRCRYVDGSGRRCKEQHRLEYHHVHTFGVGGGHDPENLRLMCKAHNRHLAECDYGREAMARFKGEADEQERGRSGRCQRGPQVRV